MERYIHIIFRKLRVKSYVWETGRNSYELVLTNEEVRLMFEEMIADWFWGNTLSYNGFIKALLGGDRKGMNIYMNKIALTTFSYFDTGTGPSEYTEPERIRKFGFAFEGKKVLIG